VPALQPATPLHRRFEAAKLRKALREETRQRLAASAAAPASGG